MVEGGRRQIDGICIKAIGVVDLHSGQTCTDVIAGEWSLNALGISRGTRAVEHGVAGTFVFDRRGCLIRQRLFGTGKAGDFAANAESVRAVGDQIG